MKIVTEIPNQQYNNIMSIDSISLGRIPYKGIVMAAINAIKRGTPPPKGHWEYLKHNKARCSVCEVIHLIAQYPHGDANYCPNCGAKMEKLQALDPDEEAADGEN